MKLRLAVNLTQCMNDGKGYLTSTIVFEILQLLFEASFHFHFKQRHQEFEAVPELYLQSVHGYCPTRVLRTVEEALEEILWRE